MHLAVDGLVQDGVEGIGVELKPRFELPSKDTHHQLTPGRLADREVLPGGGR